MRRLSIDSMAFAGQRSQSKAGFAVCFCREAPRALASMMASAIILPGPWLAALLDEAVASNAAIPGDSMLVAQLPPQDLAHRRLGQFGAELDHLGLLVAR